MGLIDILLAEHHQIDRLVRVLFTAYSQYEKGNDLTPDFYIAAARFTRVYADGIHHHKEEGILFPIISPCMAKAVEALLGEHEIARSFMRTMEQAAQAWKNGDATAVPETVKNARNYAALLHDHIMHENDVVFPATSWLITPSEYTRMNDMVENLDTDSDSADQILPLLDDLEAQINQNRP